MDAQNQITIFDRKLLSQRRTRTAANFAAHNALFEEIAERLLERLGDVKRNFTSILDLGTHDGALVRKLAKNTGASVVAADFSERTVVAEEFLPFAANSFDLIVSNMGLHWVNDLPGALLQIKNCLRPDGLFLAAMPGGQTLHELRSCLLDAELEVSGGISPRLSPTIDLPTASALLQRAGFETPVADQETITLTYPDAFALMRDLRGMGETNAHVHRLRSFSRRAIFTETARLYRERFAQSDGRIPATFDIIHLHGWKPANGES
jgi:SAM-dependent methyltransferase